MKKTFKEWNAEGRRINKGAKSTERNEAGEPLFDLLQTYNPSISVPAIWGTPESRPWDDYDDGPGPGLYGWND